MVTYVDLPMWLPGKCSKRSHILLQHKETVDPMAAPREKIWNTLYGQVRAVFIPKGVYAMTVKMKVHHLEDLVSADRGWARNKFDMEGRGASKYLISIFTSWFNRHSDELFRLRAKHARSGRRPRSNGSPYASTPGRP